MIRFIGKEGVVFQGTRTTKKVTKDFLSQEKSIQPIMDIRDGVPHTGVLIFKDDHDTKPEGAILLEPTVRPFDFVSMFRTLMVLELEPGIDSNQLLVTGHAFSTMEEQTLRHVIDNIGVRAFKRINTEMPPNLGEAIAFLENSGVEVDRDVLTQEVRAGNQVYNQVLRDAGVENPKDIDERRQRGKAAVEQYLPALRAYFDEQKHFHTAGCGCFNRLTDAAIEILKRGITEEGLVIGMASILSMVDTELNGILSLMSKITGFGVNSAIIVSVSHSLVRVLESQKAKPNCKDADYYIRTLSDLQKRWDTLPTVEL